MHGRLAVMLTLSKSAIDSTWYEIRSGADVIEEIEIRFSLYRIPKSFDSVELIHRWIEELERKLVRNRAYRLISARSYPSSLLRKKLLEKKYSETLCNEMVEELQRLGYVQDEEWARRLIEREFARGNGPRLIELKLKIKGVSPSQVRQIITREMERKKIRELMKKGKTPQSLVRKGFDYSLIEIFS